MTDVRSQISDVRCQMSDVRCQMSDVRRQMSKVRYHIPLAGEGWGRGCCFDENITRECYIPDIWYLISDF
ncbi:MAG: hypothetical protein FWC38_00195 [Proteobacteria bacterium]|nr:hypothetical protein [Pseudomonadota bacterium]